MENKVYAVKRNGVWWAAIDCGKTKKGGMITGNYFRTHFEKDGNTYRWFREIILTPENLQEWQEIKVREELICTIVEDRQERNILKFEGWEEEISVYETFQNFAKLIGNDMTIEEVKSALANAR